MMRILAAGGRTCSRAFYVGAANLTVLGNLYNVGGVVTPVSVLYESTNLLLRGD